MKRNSLFDLGGVHPSIVGSGLIALDIVYNEHQAEPIGRWTGGTCGNVLSILSWLGWSSTPIARLKTGTEASAIRQDLHKWGVNIKFVTEERAGSTPVILQYIHRKDNGEVFHRFKMRCPVCGNHLPSFRPVTGAAVAELAPRLPKADVFYFDRTSRGILDLASHYYNKGSVIVFEPSGIGEQRQFDEALEMAHIVKFSNDRINISEIALPDVYPSLHIETRGRSGLRYRCRFERYRTRSWQTVPAFELPNVRDAAGAGDWCAAGLIYKLGRGGLEAFKCRRKADVSLAFQFGQALSAWNCGFEGARGGMYIKSFDVFSDQITDIIDGELNNEPSLFPPTKAIKDFACAACQID